MTILAGRYDLGESIGRGGMAKVFKATDTRLDRVVAIKVLAPELAGDQAFVGRFQREALAAARLNHPNIVSVYDSGSVGDVHFLVMEYVQGRTLAEVLSQDGRLLPERAMEIAESVASALAAAAAAGIVHRDIKPGNIMITPRGDVRVMDFGIARMDSQQTVAQTQAVMGTASYLSPEQAQGGPVDARSDIYSLGVVLYEMLTGRTPFQGDTAVAVAMQHVQDQPVPPSQVATGIPAALDSIVLRALAKNPANRYPTADEFRRDLESARLGQHIAAPAVLPPSETQVLPTAGAPEYIEGPSGGSRWGLGILIAVILIAFGVGAFLLGRDLLGGGSSSPTPSGSPGGGKVTIPDVLGMTPSEAQVSINEAGLVLGDTRYRQTDSVAPGVVFKQDPAADQSVAEGTTVNIVVSEKPTESPSPEAGTVPDVRGMTKNEAKQAITAAGFTLGTVTNESSDTVPAGEVFKQDPKSGVQYQEQGPVDITVSTGKSTVTVPDLSCMTTARATQKLAELGLDMSIVAPPTPDPACPAANRVGSQDTPPGSEVEPGATIDVHVSGP